MTESSHLHGPSKITKDHVMPVQLPPTRTSSRTRNAWSGCWLKAFTMAWQAVVDSGGPTSSPPRVGASSTMTFRGDQVPRGGLRSRRERRSTLDLKAGLRMACPRLRSLGSRALGSDACGTGGTDDALPEPSNRSSGRQVQAKNQLCCMHFSDKPWTCHSCTTILSLALPVVCGTGSCSWPPRRLHAKGHDESGVKNSPDRPGSCTHTRASASRRVRPSTHRPQDNRRAREHHASGTGAAVGRADVPRGRRS